MTELQCKRKKKKERGGSKGRLQRRNTEKLPSRAGMVLGKEKLS